VSELLDRLREKGNLSLRITRVELELELNKRKQFEPLSDDYYNPNLSRHLF